jgi:phosphopantetheine--protein transferase-like protein
VLTDHEDAYVRDRPENFAGRWAAKEAVSKVLGLGVRGVGWREIEIVRLPTGAPICRLHERARRRADQLGMERIAVSISHEREYAVAIAFGVRTEGGAFVFPVDMEARMDDREKQLMARLRRLRELDAQVRGAEADAGLAGAGMPQAGGGASSEAGPAGGEGGGVANDPSGGPGDPSGAHGDERLAPGDPSGAPGDRGGASGDHGDVHGDQGGSSG